MKKRDLIIHIPVIHRGYLDLFEKSGNEIRNIYVLDEALLESVSPFKPDIASIDSSAVIALLKSLGYDNVSILKKAAIKKLAGPFLFVSDDVSRTLHDKYFKDADIKWKNVFLRWDKTSVLSAPSADSETSSKPFDKKMMRGAYVEAEKSSDWWRQVGALAIKGNKIVSRCYNQGAPSDHAPYQEGAIRDFLKPGERPDLVSTIHAEQGIIVDAARRGHSLKGVSLYVTHFPCAVCAKLIAFSGFAACYFGEGSSNIDGKAVLESRGVRIIRVKS